MILVRQRGLPEQENDGDAADDEQEFCQGDELLAGGLFLGHDVKDTEGV